MLWNYPIVALFVMILVMMPIGCSETKSGQDTKLIGKWMSLNNQIEFFEDQTFKGLQGNNDHGSYVILKDGRIKITGAIIGTIILHWAFSEPNYKFDLLIIKEGNDKEWFVKVKSFAKPNGIEGKWVALAYDKSVHSHDEFLEYYYEFRSDGTASLVTLGSKPPLKSKYQLIDQNNIRIYGVDGCEGDFALLKYDFVNNRLRICKLVDNKEKCVGYIKIDYHLAR